MPNLLMAEMQDGNGHHIEFKKNIFGWRYLHQEDATVIDTQIQQTFQ